MLTLIIAGLSLLVLFLVLVFFIWCLIHCIVSKLNYKQKALWIASMLIMPIIGSLLYVIFINKKGDYYDR
jgi:hypothetical protein